MSRHSVNHLFVFLASSVLIIGLTIATHHRITRPDTTASHNIWLQPDSIDRTSQHPVSNRHWDLDYSAIEHAILASNITTTHPSRYDDTTEQLLHSVTSHFPQNPDAKTEQRIQTLTTMLMPNDNGRVFSDLMMRYFHYQKHASAPTHPSRSDDAQLQALISLREHFFGKTMSDQLFGRQQTLAFYLLDREKIMSDANLTSEQRTTQLKDLHSRFAERHTTSDAS